MVKGIQNAVLAPSQAQLDDITQSTNRHDSTQSGLRNTVDDSDRFQYHLDAIESSRNTRSRFESSSIKFFLEPL